MQTDAHMSVDEVRATASDRKRKVRFDDTEDVIPPGPPVDPEESWADAGDDVLRAPRLRNEELELFENGRLRGEERMSNVSLLQETSAREVAAVVTGFNLDAELEDGYVDQFGAFVHKKHSGSSTSSRKRSKLKVGGEDGSSDEDDPWLMRRKQKNKEVVRAIERGDDDDETYDDGEPDAWADALPEGIGELHSLPGRVHLSTKRQKLDEPVDEDVDRSVEHWRRELAALLHPNETVPQALRRLGKLRKSDPSHSLSFDTVTELTQRLLDAGLYSIYQETRESLCPSLATNEGRWELRWGDEPAIYGPFKTSEMVAWKDAGYFAPSTERLAHLRRLGETVFRPASEFEPF
uniref:GYF domain-containing protein n=1 Tax=Compsopogon caeruleus TaxID=31354 RepID=A0A6T6CNK6_9RHOD|mmetsp:Transcript_6511/g.13058  ORF Transcript_6511/g.13058 Transcript_6511/m.13058 type:complete len:350 (+) Transcript_6511:1442-2491(+)|eukprot:CAMPEP_0184678648 /NCGR_PEP_ID=MMETSP0312-20130426/1415_1 /TAXON_ID=31354 /ORGANISM="Compsopogon coeruleus, Strain SAG 36.94" /LENGTH=349 /DNA_ID=CAMNT_0027127541 /DNA_START=1440 /DNA_END=2489 /DNA_ORIENTATION=-